LALALALPLSACDPGEQTPPIDDDTTDDEPPPIDLTEALGPDEARAGELTADHVGAFIGGAAGECGPGDFLMYNDRARFAIQGIREGDNYLRTPGSIIDVDVVRPTGQADRDAVDDVTALLGTSRLFHAETVEVVADGLDGGPAIIRALGSDGPFTFIEGAIESPGFFPDLHLEVEQTYTLEPGSPLLQVRTRVTNGDDEQRDITFLDGGFVDLGTMESFVPGVGVGDGFPTDGSSARVELSLRDDQAFAIFPAEGALADPGVLGDIFDSLGLMIAMGPDVEIPVGGQAEYTRYVGVAADLATLEAARRSLQSLATAKVVGTLTAADSGDPIPGARVFLTDPEGAPWTIAITGDDGGFELVGPPGEAQVVAVGDGINEQMDLPLARGAYGSHAHASANELALAAFAAPGAAVAVPQADGFGRSERIDVTLADGEAETVDLTLPDPAVLTLRTADPDGTPLPAMAWILPVGDGHQGADSRLGER
ncbi:MAG: carboxypeptidase-like regulatory domain-containing protein, partial [Myxococcota bacterium]|nr:carboxypeptidase-like regulatory domain-containing protein [Myxococcota bacterium]